MVGFSSWDDPSELFKMSKEVGGFLFSYTEQALVLSCLHKGSVTMGWMASSSELVNV